MDHTHDHDHTHEHDHDHTHDHEHDHVHEHDHTHAHEHEHHHHEHDHEHHHHEHGHEHLGDDEHMFVHFQEAKDAFMRTDPQSPIPEEERGSFQGLSYYPYTMDLNLELPLDPDVPQEPVTMETSTGDQMELRPAGKIRFEVEGQPAELTVYADEEGGLFLPLRDATSGKETYGAGRYLDLQPAEGGTINVDFNYLYNPFCAYNDAYSCPLPPMTNWLRVPIRAGEKAYR